MKLSPAQILLAGQLFFPEIVIESNCVFIKESRQYKFLQEYRNRFKDNTSLEKYINCIFLECWFPSETENIKELAEFIKQSWEIHFQKKYPELNIVTEIYEDEFDGWCVTCYRKL